MSYKFYKDEHHHIRIDIKQYRELDYYLMYFIYIRWAISMFIVISGFLTPFIEYFSHIQNVIVILIGMGLFILNSVYYLIKKKFKKTLSDEQNWKLFSVQIFFDFLTIFLLNIDLVYFESLFILFYTFHISISTVFTKRKISFVICIVACIMASAPIILVYTGIIPYVDIMKLSYITLLPMIKFTSLLVIFISGLWVYFIAIWFISSELNKNINIREIEMRVQNEKLISIDREKNKLTMRATHELKAPFAAIKSYLFILRDGYCGEISDKAQEVILKMIDRCDQLTSKITDVIRLSNLKTSIFHNEDFKHIDIVPILSDISEELKKIGYLRNITILADIPVREIIIRGNTEQIKTLLMNVMLNAINYSHDNGIVQVMIEVMQKYIVISIRDEGIGIREEDLDKIFDEYFRSKEAVAYHNNGSGLGLSIVREIIYLHGGEIDMESTPGKGTQFNIILFYN